MNFADQRVLKSTPATLAAQFVDQDGVPAVPAGTVTVGITRADGSVLLAPLAATVVDGDTPSVFTVSLTAAQTATLDHLTCTWTSSVGPVVVTHVDVVGGYMFALGALSTLDGMSSLSTQRLRDLRQGVEELVEVRTGWLWTPRLVVQSFTSTNDFCHASRLWLDHLPFRALRSVKIDGAAQTLSDWPFGEWGRSDRFYNGWAWSTGVQSTLEIIYEAGEDRAPVSLTQALLDAAKQSQLDRTSGASTRALSVINDFGNINYARATAENLFGNPVVDAVLALWDRRVPAIV